MFAQLADIGFVIGIVQAIKYFNLADPQYAPIVRAVYVFTTLIILAFYYRIWTVIKGKDEKTTITVPVPPLSAPAGGDSKRTITIMEYDLEELQKVAKQALISFAIIMTIHSYWGYIQPLILQSILPYRNLLGSPLFQIHILGRPTNGVLRRPWKDPNPFAQ